VLWFQITQITPKMAKGGRPICIGTKSLARSCGAPLPSSPPHLTVAQAESGRDALLSPGSSSSTFRFGPRPGNFPTFLARVDAISPPNLRRDGFLALQCFACCFVSLLSLKQPSIDVRPAQQTLMHAKCDRPDLVLLRLDRLLTPDIQLGLPPHGG
jgi:hypothetical protein